MPGKIASEFAVNIITVRVAPDNLSDDMLPFIERDFHFAVRPTAADAKVQPAVALISVETIGPLGIPLGENSLPLGVVGSSCMSRCVDPCHDGHFFRDGQNICVRDLNPVRGTIEL